MEDILASIRRIISDEDKDGSERLTQSHDNSPAQDTRRSYHSPQAVDPQSVTQKNSSSQSQSLYDGASPYGNTTGGTMQGGVPESPSEDDVLDLTDELILDEQANPYSNDSAVNTATVAAIPPQGKNSSRYSSVAPASRQDTGLQSAPGEKASDLSMASVASQWTRRELSQSQKNQSSFSSRSESFSRSSAGQEAQTPGRTGGSSNPSPAPASKPWIDDVQMPVPDQGPVSLVGSGSEPRTWSQRTFQAQPSRSAPQKSAIPPSPDKAAVDRSPKFSNSPFSSHKAPAAKQPVKNETADAVAAFAHNLAKSAVDGLNDKELAEAEQIDFRQLDDSRRATVTESFANAIEAAQLRTPIATKKDSVQSSILEDVLKHEFPGGSDVDESRDSDGLWPPMSAPDDMEPRPFTAPRTSQPIKKPVPASKFSGSASHLQRSAPPSTRDQLPVVDERAPPVAQAQLVTRAAATTVTEPAGRTLEDSVREMLRPLLVQWLNDNMPRIIENAIREELAERSLVPPRDPSKA